MGFKTVAKDSPMKESRGVFGCRTKILPALGGQAVVGLDDQGTSGQEDKRIVAGTVGQQDDIGPRNHFESGQGVSSAYHSFAETLR